MAMDRSQVNYLGGPLKHAPIEYAPPLAEGSPYAQPQPNAQPSPPPRASMSPWMEYGVEDEDTWNKIQDALNNATPERAAEITRSLENMRERTQLLNIKDENERQAEVNKTVADYDFEAQEMNRTLGPPRSFEELETRDPDSRVLKDSGANVDLSSPHPMLDDVDRYYVKNALWHAPQSALDFFRKKDKYKDMDFAVIKGEIVAKKKDEDTYLALDPEWSSFSDIGKDLGDVGFDVVKQIPITMGAVKGGLAAGAMTKFNPLAMAAGGMLGAGAVGAGIETAKQGVAKVAHDAPFNPTEIAIEGASSASSPLLGGLGATRESLIKRGLTAAEMANVDKVGVLNKLSKPYQEIKNKFRQVRTGVPAQVWTDYETKEGMQFVKEAEKSLNRSATGNLKTLQEKAISSKRAAEEELIDYVKWVNDIQKTGTSPTRQEMGTRKRLIEILNREADQASEAVRLEKLSVTGIPTLIAKELDNEFAKASSYINDIGQQIGDGVKRADKNNMRLYGHERSINLGEVTEELIKKRDKEIADLGNAPTEDINAIKSAYNSVIEKFLDKSQPASLMHDPKDVPVSIYTAHQKTISLAQDAKFYKLKSAPTEVSKVTGGAQSNKVLDIIKEARALLNAKVNRELPEDVVQLRSLYSDLKNAQKETARFINTRSKAYMSARKAAEGIDQTQMDNFKLLDDMTGTGFTAFMGPIRKAELFRHLPNAPLAPLSSQGGTSTSKSIIGATLGAAATGAASLIGGPELGKSITGTGLGGLLGTGFVSPLVTKKSVQVMNFLDNTGNFFNRVPWSGVKLTPGVTKGAAETSYTEGLSAWDKIQQDKLKGRIP